MDGWKAATLHLSTRSAAANLLQAGARDELAGHSKRVSSTLLYMSPETSLQARLHAAAGMPHPGQQAHCCCQASAWEWQQRDCLPTQPKHAAQAAQL